MLASLWCCPCCRHAVVPLFLNVLICSHHCLVSKQQTMLITSLLCLFTCRVWRHLGDHEWEDLGCVHRTKNFRRCRSLVNVREDRRRLFWHRSARRSATTRSRGLHPNSSAAFHRSLDSGQPDSSRPIKSFAPCCQPPA